MTLVAGATLWVRQFSAIIDQPVISMRREMSGRHSGRYVVRYYFHLRDGGERLLDPQGVDVDDPAQLERMALKEARAVISQEALEGEINLRQRIEIEDEAGNLIHSLSFADAVRIIAD